MKNKLFKKFEDKRIENNELVSGGAVSKDYIRTTYVSLGTDAIKEFDNPNTGETVTYVQYY